MHASGRRGEWTRHSLCIFSLDRRRQASRATAVPQRKCWLTATGCTLITATMLGSTSLGAHRCNLLRKCGAGRSLACWAGVAPALTPWRVLRARRHARADGVVVRASPGGGAVWPAALAPMARTAASSHPTRASRSVQVHSAVGRWSLQRETLGTHASKRALGTSRLAQFDRGLAQFACTVRTDDTLLRAALMWVLVLRSRRSRNGF
jgi:hypothetical protein